MTLPTDEGRTEDTQKGRYPMPETLPEAGWLGWLIGRGSVLFGAGILIAVVVLVMEVFLRYVFNAPTIWAHETTIFLSGITFIYGGLYCVARNTHIRVVLIYDLVGPRTRRIFDIVISLTCLTASLFFAWASWLMVKKAIFRPDGSFYMEASGSAWNSPTPAMMKIFLLAVLMVMGAQFLVLAINYARGIKPADEVAQ